MVVAHTHFSGGSGPVTITAISSDNPAAPAIVSRAVALNSLIVHEAKPFGRMAPIAPINGAAFHGTNIAHPGPRYKAMGNSWTTNVVRYLGERIEALRNAPK